MSIETTALCRPFKSLPHPTVVKQHEKIGQSVHATADVPAATPLDECSHAVRVIQTRQSQSDAGVGLQLLQVFHTASSACLVFEELVEPDHGFGLMCILYMYVRTHYLPVCSMELGDKVHGH